MPHRTIAEWPTLACLAGCYVLWLAALFWAPTLWSPLAIVLATLSIALHASLTHEVIHGHPTANARLNALCVWPALGVLVPYARFRDTHLAHHRDARLTDPYDDPESNYLDPAVWQRLPHWRKTLLRANNTLMGRIVFGPMIGQIGFMAGEWAAFRAGDRAIGTAWAAHLPAMAVVLAIVWIAPMPLWAYALAVYAGSATLRIRTFLEHRAHEHTAARTVIVEDRGPLALLFLNNNFHLVHHMHPGVSWFRLPALYEGDAERYLRRNRGYRYRSYAEVFSRHLFRAKDPVAHPLWTAQATAAPEIANVPGTPDPSPAETLPAARTVTAAQAIAAMAPDPVSGRPAA